MPSILYRSTEFESHGARRPAVFRKQKAEMVGDRSGYGEFH